MLLQYCLVALMLGAGMFLSVKAGKLTGAGALAGGLVGSVIFLGAGFAGLAMLAAFFIVGTTATSWKINYKVSQGLAEENKGRRKASQVLANGGVAGLAALLTLFFPAYADIFLVMLAASIAAATSDTLSSELGNVYGRKYYNILTWQPDERGLDGVVSLEGTLWGLVGSGLVGLLYGLGFGWTWGLVCVVAAGMAGNLADSVLGATLERRHRLNNDAVNFLNTFLAALTALLLYLLGGL